MRCRERRSVDLCYPFLNARNFCDWVAEISFPDAQNTIMIVWRSGSVHKNSAWKVEQVCFERAGVRVNMRVTETHGSTCFVRRPPRCERQLVAQVEGTLTVSRVVLRHGCQLCRSLNNMSRWRNVDRNTRQVIVTGKRNVHWKRRSNLHCTRSREALQREKEGSAPARFSGRCLLSTLRGLLQRGSWVGAPCPRFADWLQPGSWVGAPCPRFAVWVGALGPRFADQLQHGSWVGAPCPRFGVWLQHGSWLGACLPRLSFFLLFHFCTMMSLSFSSEMPQGHRDVSRASMLVFVSFSSADPLTDGAPCLSCADLTW